MAMHDPRMKQLLEIEGMKGFGAYWVILEKLELLPDARAQLEYLRPFCKNMNISFAYLKKVILNYGLFELEEDGYFTALELNPIKKTEKKTAKNCSESADSNPKNERKLQKTAGENCRKQRKKTDNTLVISKYTKQETNVLKYNIIYITSASIKEKEKPAAADNFPTILHCDSLSHHSEIPLHHYAATVSSSASQVGHTPFEAICNDTGSPQPRNCHTSTGQMPHFNKANATLQSPPSVAIEDMRCGISGTEVWHLQTKTMHLHHLPTKKGSHTLCNCLNSSGAENGARTRDPQLGRLML